MTRIDQTKPSWAEIQPPFQNIQVKEGEEFRMTIVIANKAQLDEDSVIPSAVEFEKEDGSIWQIPSRYITYSAAGILIDLPLSFITFTGLISLHRILASSAHGSREIWP